MGGYSDPDKPRSWVADLFDPRDRQDLFKFSLYSDAE